MKVEKNPGANKPETDGQGQATKGGAPTLSDDPGAPAPAQAPPCGVPPFVYPLPEPPCDALRCIRDLGTFLIAEVHEWPDVWQDLVDVAISTIRDQRGTIEELNRRISAFAPVTSTTPRDEALARNEPTAGRRITLQEADVLARQDLAGAEERRAEFAEQEARGGAVWEESDSPASDPVAECREAAKLLVLRALGQDEDVRDLLWDKRSAAMLARLAGDAAYELARATDLLDADVVRAPDGADLSDSIRARADVYLVPMLRLALAACIGYLRAFAGPGPTPEGVSALFPEAQR